MRLWQYCAEGVWEDTSRSRRVQVIRTINLAVNCFVSKGLQQRACALTYSTVLAVVPVLAMLFAIARGFGFHKILQSELFRYFPAQREALSSSFLFVDRYLQQASQGVFVGIGVLFLLWTLVSLMRNVELSFNEIWGIKRNRSIYRQITDYTVLFLFLPILMIASAGINIMMDDGISSVMLRLHIISPTLRDVLNITPIAMECLTFVCAFWLIPNTRVPLRDAAWPGIACGVLAHALQWVFVSGQVYVSKYNAIYGSFAFLPLLLIWLQLLWLLTLSGMVMVYSLHNVANLAYSKYVRSISRNYSLEMTVAMLVVIAKRFEQMQRPLSSAELSKLYGVPLEMVTDIVSRLTQAGLLRSTRLEGETDMSHVPALPIEKMTVCSVEKMLNNYGYSDFVPLSSGSQLSQVVERLREHRRKQQQTDDIALSQLIEREK